MTFLRTWLLLSSRLRTQRSQMRCRFFGSLTGRLRLSQLVIKVHTLISANTPEIDGSDSMDLHPTCAPRGDQKSYQFDSWRCPVALLVESSQRSYFPRPRLQRISWCKTGFRIVQTGMERTSLSRSLITNVICFKTDRGSNSESFVRNAATDLGPLLSLLLNSLLLRSLESRQ
jgi:hypothetical protein